MKATIMDRNNKELIVADTTTNLGRPPAIVLNNPKFAHNVGAAVRAASCYNVGQVFFSGSRINLTSEKGDRLPREERMKGYAAVDLVNTDYPFDCFADAVPVAIEVRENSEQLPTFEHPENAVYVFGPEDGSINKAFLGRCHRFVIVPTRHCMNLAATINVVLYDRFVKRQRDGLEPILPTSELLNEDRGYAEPELYDGYGEWKGNEP